MVTIKIYLGNGSDFQVYLPVRLVKDAGMAEWGNEVYLATEFIMWVTTMKVSKLGRGVSSKQSIPDCYYRNMETKLISIQYFVSMLKMPINVNHDKDSCPLTSSLFLDQ